jgi:hypothetical protein
VAIAAACVHDTTPELRPAYTTTRIIPVAKHATFQIPSSGVGINREKEAEASGRSWSPGEGGRTDQRQLQWPSRQPADSYRVPISPTQAAAMATAAASGQFYPLHQDSMTGFRSCIM